ncbi:hypothetical protein [Vibrio mediterranei]|uniref:hypothetical protein n=1 Tax=Vibrio mediterranei TaxID=689 RepID=UPI001EFE0D0A|nr:hypothetical protein [Vibrio mediterranei]MCG9660871.1 hypothetical protein [Vibrio mediterranei]
MNLNESLILKFIEAKLLTDKQVSTRHIVEMFGCGRQHASKMFRIYRIEWPDSIKYEPRGSGSAYEATEKFEARYLQIKPYEFLESLEKVIK